MKYSAADIARMKAELDRKRQLLREAERRGDNREANGLRNEIRGLENSISGKYN